MDTSNLDIVINGVDTITVSYLYYNVQSECKCLDMKRVDMYSKGKTPLAFESLKTFKDKNLNFVINNIYSYMPLHVICNMDATTHKPLSDPLNWSIIVLCLRDKWETNHDIYP